MASESSGVRVAIRIRKLINRELKACEPIRWQAHDQSVWEINRNDAAYTFGRLQNPRPVSF